MRVVASLILTMSLLIMSMSGCSLGRDGQDSDSSQQLPDTLRVATLYSPTSYFIYRDAMLGFDYSLVSEFANDNSTTIDLIVAPNMENMINMLENGEVDLVAYDIPITSDYKDRVLHCGIDCLLSHVYFPQNASLLFVHHPNSEPFHALYHAFHQEEP